MYFKGPRDRAIMVTLLYFIEYMAAKRLDTHAKVT